MNMLIPLILCLSKTVFIPGKFNVKQPFQMIIIIVVIYNKMVSYTYICVRVYVCVYVDMCMYVDMCIYVHVTVVEKPHRSEIHF